jgi:hypothetical protein
MQATAPDNRHAVAYRAHLARCYGPPTRAESRRAELLRLISSLERASVQAASLRDRERAAYYPTAPPSSAYAWSARVAARRCRLAMWVLEQIGFGSVPKREPTHVVLAAAIVLPALREAMECRRDVASALEAHAFETVPATLAYWDEP